MSSLRERVGLVIESWLQRRLTAKDQRIILERDLIEPQMAREDPKLTDRTVQGLSVSHLSADPADTLIGISLASVNEQQGPSKKPK